MTQPLCIAFIWHMHQPVYREPGTGACHMPWVRLHGTKDYLDMVLRLADTPAVHQTFNVVPSLVDQLEAYLPPQNRSDDFLELSRRPADALTDREKRFVIEWFFLANPERLIRPHPRYHDLLAKRGAHVTEAQWPDVLRRFRAQDVRDLQVWFNLAWVDPWLRRQDPRVSALEGKGGGFTEEDKAAVLQAHLDLLGRILPAYREAASRGQIELTASPYYHPILPLLCDTRSARAALPDLPLPKLAFRHPEDARWQIETGLARHAQVFGDRPRGMWPSEGSVSEETLALLLEAGIEWTATDEAILWRTLGRIRNPEDLYRPHRLERDGRSLWMVFRDRELSDLIGFTYSKWEADAAATDLTRRLGEIHQRMAHAPRQGLVSVILDGENAWEGYRDDGHPFLTALYHALAGDPRFRCVTVSEYLREQAPQDAPSLPPVAAGSWIDANFATWIGHPEKNTAWTRLAELREALRGANIPPDRQQAVQHSLGMAEGSDWMWWFGDTHVTAQPAEFDRLFRAHVSQAYRLAGLEPPPSLRRAIRRRTTLSLEEPTGLVRPTLDGRETSYYEWLYAGRINLRRSGAIHRSQQTLTGLAYGFDHDAFYVRLDLDLERLPVGWAIQLDFGEGRVARLSAGQEGGIRGILGEGPAEPIRCAMDRLLEVAVPLRVLALRPDERVEFALTLIRGDDVLERHPDEGAFHLLTSAADLDAVSWSA